ncbi:MAG: PKD domain-containing protein, partial [Methylococcaceae bacterium]
MLTKTANGSLCRFFLLSFLALSLFISPVNQSHAVTTENFDGMVTSVVIDPEGWSMSVTIQGFKKNGTYILDPEGTPKVRLKVFSEGYDKNGNSTVVERSLIATKAVRKVYPDDGELNETETGTSLIVHLALNKPIYNDDKNGGTATSGQNPVVTFSRGWYQDREEIGSSLEAKETIIEAVNESTLDYPKVIGNWAWPGWDTVDQDFDLEAVFFHGHAIDQKPVALVEFDATDDSGNNSPQKLTNDLIISKKNDRNPVLVYSATMDVSSLASGELIKARFRAYPWVGDEDSILDSDSGTEKPSPLYGPYHLFNDKDGLYGSSVAYVDVNGSDTSGMVDDVAQSATVKNFPFQTIAAAVNAIKAFNELNFGRNDPSGSTVYLNAGTHNWIDGNVTESLTGSTYLTITKAPEVDKSEAIISSTGTRNILNAPFLKIEDVTISRSQISTTGNLLRGSADQVIWLDNCQIEGLGHINGPTVYLYGNAYFTNNIINEANNIFEFGATSAVSALIRNNEIRNSGRLHPYVLLGNNIFDTRVLLDSVNENIPLFDNSVIAFNKFLDLSNFAISFAASQNISHGFGLVQNLIERSGSGPSPVLQMSGDGSKTTTNHVIMWHNTIVGERSNLYYNDVGEEAYRQSNMSMVGNIMNEFNIKSDTFNHPVEHQNPARTGNWEPLYGAGYYGNLSHTGATSDAFQYEFFGLSSIWNQVGPNDDPKQDFVFIHDASFGTGDGTGNGDYGIKENSLADNLMNSQQVLPYDLKGVVRLNNCKGAAGAFEYNQETVMCINVVNVSPSAQGLRISWRFPSKDITSYKVFRSGLLLANTTQNTIVDDQVNVLQQDPILTYTIQAFNDNNEFVADITQQFSPLRNVTPSSNAGPDQVLVDSDLDGEEPVLLDGTGSSDSDGTIVSYEWSEAGVSLATGSQPSVTLAVGSHDITLQVTDNSGATASDTVTITVEAGAGGSENPTANAGPDQVLADSNFDGEEI